MRCRLAVPGRTFVVEGFGWGAGRRLVSLAPAGRCLCWPRLAISASYQPFRSGESTAQFFSMPMVVSRNRCPLLPRSMVAISDFVRSPDTNRNSNVPLSIGGP
jgi:hypothetical protein